MSKSKQKNNPNKALTEKLREAELPQDRTCLIGRVYEFTAENGSVFAGKITSLQFISSENILNLFTHDAIISIQDNGKKLFMYQEEGKGVEGELKFL